MKLLLRILLFAAAVGAVAFIKIKYFPKENAAMGAPMGGGSGGAKGGTPSVTVNGYVIRAEKLDNKIFATGASICSRRADCCELLCGESARFFKQSGSCARS